MPKAPSPFRARWRYIEDKVLEISDDLGKNNLWKRMLKNVLATTILVAIVIIPKSSHVLGKAAYLGAITTVFGHPGRRFGQMAEALILVVAGTSLGVAWSTLGVYLGSLVIMENPPAAYAIRALFLVIAVLFHGYLRSRTPRLFIFVLLLIICSTVTLVSTAKVVTPVGVTQILYPILVAAGVLTIVNVVVFPEFSSGFLGRTTIETLNETAKALEDAGNYFVAVKSSGAAQKVASTDGSESPQLSDTGNATTKITPSRSNGAGTRLSLKQRLLRLLGNLRQNEPEAEDLTPRIHVPVTIMDLTATKVQIRKKLEDCKVAQQECNYEIAVSVLPPRDVKPISNRAMKKLVANTIAVIGACESRFALVGEETEEELENNDDHPRKTSTSDDKTAEEQEEPRPLVRSRLLSVVEAEEKEEEEESVGEDEKDDLEAIKPKREIEFGDVRLLRYLTSTISKPYQELHQTLDRTVQVIAASVAYVHDVPKLPDGRKAPQGVLLEELDVHVDAIHHALLKFDQDCANALESANALEELQDKEPDIMPREEVFLISSFMLNVRQAGTHLEDMLKYSRELVEKRQARHDRRRIYAPRIKWRKWLYTGGEDELPLPIDARQPKKAGLEKRKSNNEDDDSTKSDQTLLKESGDHGQDAPIIAKNRSAEESKCSSPNVNLGPNQPKASFELRIRGKAADIMEWMQESEDLLYAAKLAVAVFLILWPAFVAKWNTWYSLERGLWAALQLILITEVSIGTSVMTFILRGIGTTLGCLWGWAAVEAHNGNRVVCTAMIAVGCIPCCYVQLGTKYPKAGMVTIVSICVVALSSELRTVPGTPTENFLKRWIAFSIGGVVALLVEVMLLPVKARTRLVESIASALQQITEMEKYIAYGIDSGVKVEFIGGHTKQFEKARSKANSALTAAETFLPFCSTEPRLKGSFEPLALIYTEILFVLHQIVDRMENMTALRTAYGSGPLEEFNPLLYPYRRNVAASIILTLFAVRSALVTKLPLPQFLPSARVAHLRMVNKVRAVVIDAVRHHTDAGEDGGSEMDKNGDGADASADEKVGPHDEEEGKVVKVVKQEEKEQEDDEAWISKQARRRAVRKKYLSWNAASAAQAEIIEFLEELVELAKLIVGASEFRSGVLARTHMFGAGAGADGGGGYIGRLGGHGGLKTDGLDRSNTIGEMDTVQTKDPTSGAHVDADVNVDEEDRDPSANVIDPAAPSPRDQHPTHMTTTKRGKSRGNTVTSMGSIASGTSSAEGHPAAAPGLGGIGGHVPVSLMRIQSRKRDAAELKRVGAGDGEEGPGKSKGKGKGKGGVGEEGV